MTAPRFQPQLEPKLIRFRERHRLVCPKGCELQYRRERICGGIHRCDKCGCQFTISGVWEAPNGRDYYAIHYLKREQLVELDQSPGMTTVDDIFRVLGLD